MCDIVLNICHESNSLLWLRTKELLFLDYGRKNIRIANQRVLVHYSFAAASLRWLNWRFEIIGPDHLVNKEYTARSYANALQYETALLVSLTPTANA